MDQGSFTVDVIERVGEEWARAEEQIRGAGLGLPLPHRACWLRGGPEQARLVLLRDAEQRCHGGFALRVGASRAVPGTSLLRVERYGPGLTAAGRVAGLQFLADYARRDRRVLRASVELFVPHDAERAALERAAAAAGLRRAPAPRGYTATVAVDLRPDEETILAGLHATARRHIRAVRKHPVEVRCIGDAALVPRMARLHAETMARTGGDTEQRDWPRIVVLSRAAPECSRLIGLFRTDVGGPASLLAFAWGEHHGDHAHYSASASTRETDLRLPMLYALVWDLLCWSRRNGAAWFDLGGITEGSARSDDPLGGISDFKRFFSTRRVELGGEWQIEPRPLLGAASRLASAVARRLGR